MSEKDPPGVFEIVHIGPHCLQDVFEVALAHWRVARTSNLGYAKFHAKKRKGSICHISVLLSGPREHFGEFSHGDTFNI